MGQSGSKPPGSLPFGHVAFLDTSSPTTIIQQSTDNDQQQNSKEEETHNDRLLSVPHQYYLTTTYNGSRNNSSNSNSNFNSSTCLQYRPCTPPTPPTPLSFNFSSSPSSSSSSSFSLATLSHITDHMDTLHNNNNDEISPSHWMTLMNDVTYVDTTYYQKPSPPPNNNQNTGINDENENESPLPPLPSFTMTEKPLTTTDLKSIDKTMHVISLIQQNLIRLNPNIGLFTMICKLDLTNNKLSSLPDTIGYLHRLESLYVGNNQLEALPDTIGHLTKLIELDVSHNQLNTLTPCIAYLKKLQVLTASHNNNIHELPVHLAIGLKGLTILDLSYTAISVLPAEITQLHFLRRLLLDGCPLIDPPATTSTSATFMAPPMTATVSSPTGPMAHKPPCYSQLHSPPSLLEQCARTIVRDTRHHAYYQQRIYRLSYHLVSYLYSATPCTLCQGPYFDTYVTRGRLVERSGRWTPVEYRLCRAHFTNETDRLLCMFSSEGASTTSTMSTNAATAATTSAATSSLSWNQPYRPPLPALSKKKNKKSGWYSTSTLSLTTPSPSSSSSSIYQDASYQHQAASLMMESVVQQQQQSQQDTLPSDADTRMDPINSNGWRAHRMKVMNKNQSGFLSLTKSTLPGGGGRGGGETGDTIPPQQQV